MNGVSGQESGEETTAVRGATRQECGGWKKAATGYWNVKFGELHGWGIRSAG